MLVALGLKRTSAAIVILGLALFPSSAPAQAPLTSAFTYQGHLASDGRPANGPHDMTFHLFDAPTAGNPIGGPVVLPAVSVDEGLFTVQLNAANEFGPSAFTGERRWLEVMVNGTTLSPRQEVTAAPYALFALNAAGAEPHWASSGSNIHNTNGGNVGIGTDSPDVALQVVQREYIGSFLGANNQGLRIVGDDNANAWTLLGFDNGAVKNVAQIGSRYTGGGTYLAFGTSDNYATGITNQAMTIDPAGRVGIGTTSPGYHLTVEASSPGQPLAVFRQGDSSGYGVSITPSNDSAPFYALRIRDRAESVDRHLFRGDGQALLAIGGGSVGIGTTEPALPLHVAGSSDSANGQIQVSNTGTAGAGLRLVSMDTGGHEFHLISTGTNNDPGAGTLSVYDATASSYRLTLSASGNLGVGTHSPTRPLHVNAGTGAQGTGAEIGLGSTGNPMAAIKGILRSSNNGDDAGDLVFKTRSESLPPNPPPDPMERMRITADGQVGIGTTTPQAVLDVNGMTRTTALQVTSGAEQGRVLTSDAEGVATWQALPTQQPGVPQGVIVMWSGALASIPAGWVLCDGSNGTPDLRDRFVLGAASGQNPGRSGGASTHAHQTTVSTGGTHVHSVSLTTPVFRATEPIVNELDQVRTYVTNVFNVSGQTQLGGDHSHAVGINAQTLMPPYYTLAYIMKL